MSEESTTPDLVAMTRRVFDAFNSRELDAALRLFALDVVVDMTRTLGVALQGRDEFRAFLGDWLVGYEEFTYASEVYLQTARPKGATGYVSQREAAVLEEGLVVAQTAYPQSDIDEARAAAERLAAERG